LCKDSFQTSAISIQFDSGGAGRDSESEEFDVATTKLIAEG
jgi:hypothetical protein